MQRQGHELVNNTQHGLGRSDSRHRIPFQHHRRLRFSSTIVILHSTLLSLYARREAALLQARLADTGAGRTLLVFLFGLVCAHTASATPRPLPRPRAASSRIAIGSTTLYNLCCVDLGRSIAHNGRACNELPFYPPHETRAPRDFALTTSPIFDRFQWLIDLLGRKQSESTEPIEYSVQQCIQRLWVYRPPPGHERSHSTLATTD